MAMEAEDNKKREYLDTERYRQESEFTALIEGLMHQSVLHKRKIKLDSFRKGKKKELSAKESTTRETDVAKTLMMIDWMKGMLKKTDET
jgi:hypothetical protein